MTQMATRRLISVQEHEAISELFDIHMAAQNGNLRAALAFGEFVTSGNTYDIDLLEIVDDWKGVRFAEFASTPELRLRGRLRLYFLSLSELEDPDSIADLRERDWAYSVLERVSRGYETMYDATQGQLRRILSSPSPLPPTVCLLVVSR